MSAHLVLALASVALGAGLALVGLAVVVGRVDVTKVQRAVRAATTKAQRRMAVRVIDHGLTPPSDEVAVVGEVARGRVSQGAFVSAVVAITLLCLPAVGTGSPSWLQVASPVVTLVNFAVAMVITIRVRRARRFLTTGPDAESAAPR